MYLILFTTTIIECIVRLIPSISQIIFVRNGPADLSAMQIERAKNSIATLEVGVSLSFRNRYLLAADNGNYR